MAIPTLGLNLAACPETSCALDAEDTDPRTTNANALLAGLISELVRLPWRRTVSQTHAHTPPPGAASLGSFHSMQYPAAEGPWCHSICFVRCFHNKQLIIPHTSSIVLTTPEDTRSRDQCPSCFLNECHGELHWLHSTHRLWGSSIIECLQGPNGLGCPDARPVTNLVTLQLGPSFQDPARFPPITPTGPAFASRVET